MRLSLLLICISALLALSGVCGEAINRAGLDRRRAVFFLFCIAVLDTFLLHPAEQLYISPACVFAAIWLYSAAYLSCEPIVALSLLFGVISGAALFPLAALGAEWTPFIIGIASALPAFLLDTLTAASSAVLAPLASHIAAFAFGVLTDGYASLELTESALSSQLFALICTFIIRSALYKEKANSILQSKVS